MSKNCHRTIKFKKKNSTKKNFFDFCDAVFIMTYPDTQNKKRTSNQLLQEKNIEILGCRNITYWCYTKGYKCSNSVNIDKNIHNIYAFLFKFSLIKKFKNILIIEDDMIIVGDIWKNYLERKKEIIKILNKKEKILFQFGHAPVYYKKINKYIAEGFACNTHCILYNNLAMKYYLKHIYHKLKNSKSHLTRADFYYINYPKLKNYLLIPNNLFFQKDDSNSTSSKYINNSNILTPGYLSFYYLLKLQQQCTGQYYNQYDPKFVNYWEPLGPQFIYHFPEIIFLFIIFILLVVYKLRG